MKHCLADPPGGNDSPRIQAFRPNVRSIFRFNNKAAAKKTTTTKMMMTNRDSRRRKDLFVPSKVGTKLFRFTNNKTMRRNKNLQVVVDGNQDDGDNIPLLELSHEVRTPSAEDVSAAVDDGNDDDDTQPDPTLMYDNNNNNNNSKLTAKYRPTITRASAIFSPDSLVVESLLPPGVGSNTIQTKYPDILPPDIFSPRPRMEFFFQQKREREEHPQVQQVQQPQHPQHPPNEQDDGHSSHFGGNNKKQKTTKQKLQRSSSQISHIPWFRDLPSIT